MSDVQSAVTGWASAPGPRGAALARILVATSLLLVIRGLDSPTSRIPAGPPELYRPVGPARLVPVEWWRPDVVTVLLVVATIAAFAALVGRWSRSALAVAYGSALLLVAASHSWSDSWSHGENLTFLAGFPVLLAAHGDSWSLDARRRDDRPERSALYAYGLPVRAAQVLIGVYFFNAAYWKLTRTGLAWALSDNLRNILTIRYDVLDVPPPPLARIGLANGGVARLLAVGNLIAQALPLLLVPFLRSRWARLLAFVLVSAEAVGLTAVMGLFHGEMLPLGAILLAHDPREPAPTEATPQGGDRRSWIGRAVVVGSLMALVIGQSVVAWTKDDARLRLYPLTSTPMFSTTYGPEYARLRIVTDPPLPADEARRVREVYTLPVGTDECRLHRRLALMVAEAKAVHGVDLRSILVEEEQFLLEDGEATLQGARPVVTTSADTVEPCL